MNDVARILYVATLGATLCSSARASAQTASVNTDVAPDEGALLRARTSRMQAALARLAQENATSGGTVALHLGLGALYTGAGVIIAFDRSEEPRDSFFRGLAATETFLIGGAQLASGIYGLSAGAGVDEARYARFQRELRAGQLTERQLARYEGELFADAAISRSQRRYGGWISLGQAAAGAGLIVLAATSDMRGTARTLTYVEGAVLTPFCGISGFVALSSESANEREWQRYRGEYANRTVAQVSVVPVLAPGRMLLVASGNF